MKRVGCVFLGIFMLLAGMGIQANAGEPLNSQDTPTLENGPARVPDPAKASGSAGPVPEPDAGGQDSWGYDDLDDELFGEYDTTQEQVQSIPDPLYKFNYAMYHVNDYLYFYGLKPVAQGYKKVVPTPVRRSVNNFYENLLFPLHFVNCLLQGKVSQAGNEFAIFFVNSTLGFAGLNDFAQKYMDVHTHDEDFGQTLATWGVGDGFYLVLPVLGPSNLRDSIALGGDYFLSPLNYIDPKEVAWGIWGVSQINRTSFRIGDYEALKEASVDPYTAIRNAYVQNRKSLIRQ